MSALPGHHNHSYDGGTPNVPYAVGDRYYGQDRARDFWHVIGAAALSMKEAIGKYPTKLSGGMVNPGTTVATQVTIGSGHGICDYTVSVPASPWAIPPTVTTVDVPVGFSWTALSNQAVNAGGVWAATLDGSTPNYLCVAYAEADAMSRSRAKKTGSYYAEKTASFAWRCSSTAPTDKEIVLATVVGNGATALTITNYPLAGEYDLVIDSNAKLDLWCQAVAGQYKRVYIKAGTWTASALSPTGGVVGVLVNLSAAGTVYVFAERGSSVNYSGAYNGVMYGLYHASPTTGINEEKFENVKVTLTNTDVVGSARVFYQCANLHDCVGIATGEINSGGFDTCVHLVGCTGTGSGGTAGNGYGFYSCSDLVDCIGTGTGISTGDGAGFTECTYLVNCDGTGSGGATGDGYGFVTCYKCTNCNGIGSGGSTSGDGNGFSNCTGVTNSYGKGLAAGSGSGYGYNGCKKMQQNSAGGVSKTATYNASYADAGSSNAAADTAAGGYNS